MYVSYILHAFYVVLFIQMLFLVSPKIILQLTDVLANETNNVQFVCQAIGVPFPYIRWYFNGVMVNLSDSSKYNSSSMYLNESIIKSTLNIINVESSDVGRYTCEAANIIGSDRSSGILTVNSKFVLTYIHTLYYAHMHKYICKVGMGSIEILALNFSIMIIIK